MHPTLHAQSPLQELAELLLACAPNDGIHPTGLPGVFAIRVSRPGDEFTHALHRPAVRLIAHAMRSIRTIPAACWFSRWICRSVRR